MVFMIRGDTIMNRWVHRGTVKIYHGFNQYRAPFSCLISCFKQKAHPNQNFWG